VIEDSPSVSHSIVNGGFDVFGFTVHDKRNELQENETKTFDSMIKLADLIECRSEFLYL
jgi:hypothetical protein